MSKLSILPVPLQPFYSHYPMPTIHIPKANNIPSIPSLVHHVYQSRPSTIHSPPTQVSPSTSNVYLPSRLLEVFAASFFFSPYRPAKLRFSYCNFSSSCSSQPPQLNFFLLFPSSLRYHPSFHPPRYSYSRNPLFILLLLLCFRLPFLVLIFTCLIFPSPPCSSKLLFFPLLLKHCPTFIFFFLLLFRLSLIFLFLLLFT